MFDIIIHYFVLKLDGAMCLSSSKFLGIFFSQLSSRNFRMFLFLARMKKQKKIIKKMLECWRYYKSFLHGFDHLTLNKVFLCCLIFTLQDNKLYSLIFMSHDKFVFGGQKHSITVKEESKAIATQGSLCHQQRKGMRKSQKRPKTTSPQHYVESKLTHLHD